MKTKYKEIKSIFLSKNKILSSLFSPGVNLYSKHILLLTLQRLRKFFKHLLLIKVTNLH